MTSAPPRPTGRALARTAIDDLVRPDGGLPCTVHAEIHWPETLDPDRVRRAAAATVTSHPLLSATLDPALDRWQLPERPPEPEVRTRDVERLGLGRVRGEAVSRPLDGPAGPGSAGAAFVLAAGDGTDRLLLLADHRIVDGIGIGRAAATFVERYRADAPGPTDTSWRAARRSVRAPATTAAGLPPGARPAVPRPVPARLEPARHRSAAGFGVTYRPLSPTAEAALAGRPVRSSANDVLVAAAAVAIAHWNREHGGPTGPVAIGVPVNLRPASSWSSGVANASALWPVRLLAPTPRSALAQVLPQTRPLRLGGSGPAVRALVGALAGRSAPPLWARHLVGSCTTVLSHVPALPSAATTDPPPPILGGAPASRTMPVTFAVIVDATGCTLSARYRRDRFRASDVHALLALVDRSVVEVVRSARPAEA